MTTHLKTTLRLALQIFRKDIERLWWAVLLCIALLALFAYQDATRTITVPALATNNGWLNLALPFAWSLLIALVIIQDPLAGDRQFWVSLPCGWQSLLAAKSAFIAAFIQLPYFLATAAILLAKGFNPLEHTPHLFWKQLVLLALILPAAAVAAVVKNVTYFLLVVMSVAGGLILMSNRINRGYGSDTSWDVRWDLAVLILSAGALSVAILQFTRRSTRRARVIAVVSAVAAFSVCNWLSRDSSAAIRAAVSPAHSAPISVTIGSFVPTSSDQQRYYNNRRTTILLPIEFSGLGSNVRLDQISFKLTSTGGERYEAQWPDSSNDIRTQRITADLDMFRRGRPSFQTLELYNAETSKRLLSGPVTIKGRMLARSYQPGQSTALRPVGRTDVPGLGYCLNSLPVSTRRPFDIRLTLECDSPELAAGQMLMNGVFFLRDRISISLSHYPQDPWLSPLHRTVGPIMQPATQTIAPATSLGSAVIDYTFPNVDLNRFLVREVRQ